MKQLECWSKNVWLWQVDFLFIYGICFFLYIYICLLYIVTGIKRGIGNFIVCCFAYSSTWCQVEIGGDWLKDYLIILEIWIDIWRIIHSSTSKGLYNFFNIQSFWVNQITNFLFFFYSFFGLNYAKFFNDFILCADMIQFQNTKPDKSWCFFKKKSWYYLCIYK